MAIKDWYKLTFQIESDSEEIIIWKLNKLGIFSFSFEYLINSEYNKEVKKLSNVIFGGRLAKYQYYDMDKIVGSALVESKKFLANRSI